MMRIHLASLRRFHPDAPILVSTRGGDQGEMEAWRREFGIEYWLEECGYTDAYLRLLLRCPTPYACILDHDTVLLAGLDGLLAGLADGRFDLAGIEERIRLPEHLAGDWWPASSGWLRFAPGCTASNFLLFDWPDKTALYPFLRVEVDGHAFTMVRWDRAVMRKLLGQRGVVATDFEAWLDEYLRTLDGRSADRVRTDLVAFELVYFRWHDDAARKARIVQWLAQR